MRHVRWEDTVRIAREYVDAASLVVVIRQTAVVCVSRQDILGHYVINRVPMGTLVWGVRNAVPPTLNVARTQVGTRDLYLRYFKLNFYQ